MRCMICGLDPCETDRWCKRQAELEDYEPLPADMWWDDPWQVGEWGEEPF